MKIGKYGAGVLHWRNKDECCFDWHRAGVSPVAYEDASIGLQGEWVCKECCVVAFSLYCSKPVTDWLFRWWYYFVGSSGWIWIFRVLVHESTGIVVFLFRRKGVDLLLSAWRDGFVKVYDIHIQHCVQIFIWHRAEIGGMAMDANRWDHLFDHEEVAVRCVAALFGGYGI